MISAFSTGTPLERTSSALTRTSAPCAVSEKMDEKVRCRVSVNTKEPATKAVPSTTDRTVSASRTLWAARLRSDTVRMGFWWVDFRRAVVVAA